MPDTKPDIESLVALAKRLRDPDRGCPWDIAQSFDTLGKFAVEEAYEVADALVRKDHHNLREELGDLLFQVVLLSQLAEEQNLFNFNDVVADITTKMIDRHPHVFGNQTANSVDEVNTLWATRKAKEKAARAQKQTSLLDDVPVTLPALSRIQKILNISLKNGFAFSSLNELLEKVEEEYGELLEAIKEDDKAHIEEEFSDTIMTMVKIALYYGFDAEDAVLKSINNKYIYRFNHVEQKAKVLGKEPKDLTPDEWLAYWIEAKLLSKSKAA